MSLLPWLPRHSDLNAAVRGAHRLADRGEKRRDAVLLAGYDRDAISTNRIDRLSMGAEDAAPSPLPGFTPFRIAMLGSHSLEHLPPAIRVAGLTRKLDLSIHVGDYGQYRSPLLDGDATLETFAPQAILLALDYAAVVPSLPLSTSQAEIDQVIEQVVEDLRGLWGAVRDRYGALPIQQTFIDQSLPFVGSNEALLPASAIAIGSALNARLRRVAAENGVPLVDIARLPAEIDGIRAYDPVRWYQAKQLVNPALAPLYGDLVARVAAAIAGRARKCLILDLDNTLWGGVIGDDGIENIALGQGSAEGEAFAAFQKYAAGLAARGVILAVCSKNDEAVARSVFDRHPEMQLACSDIACFVANWSDKASNVRSIAQTLNIGIDSLVFVDDNPAERAIIRRELPEVAVPELPDDVAFYPERLATAGYFEAVSITPDDFARSGSYQANARRSAALEVATDMDGYLRSLEMQLIAGSISPIDRARAVQLINKSNQFNLTTIRRTEEELLALMQDPATIALSFRLRDKFGDNGLISVVIARRDPAWPTDAHLIDTWLMSCRVLGRGVETAVLGVLAETAAKLGASALIGEYRPSGRNAMVERHYEKLGFQFVEQPPVPPADDRFFWRRDLAGAVAGEHHLQIEVNA